MEEPSPVEQVEAYLRIQHLYNVEHKIWPGNNVVIERLLADNINMADVYNELFRICPRGYPRNWKYERWTFVIDAIIETASGFNLKEIKSLRDAISGVDGKNGVNQINQSIKEKASELAALLRDRDSICELKGLTRPIDFHPLWLIEPATKIASIRKHYRYTSWVKKNIDALCGQFDLKYWPSTADMLDALADMQDVEPTPQDRADAAVLGCRQISSATRVFLRALQAKLLKLYAHDLEISIKFSDESLATIADCALGLDGEPDSENVKKFRADGRRRNK